MEFEDNFVCPKVYPYSLYMYDPLLKVRVQITSYHELTVRDVPIAIYYDPEIEAGHLTVPVSEETKASWRSSPLRRHMADDDRLRFSFRSDKEIMISDVMCLWEKANETARLKISLGGETFVKIGRRIRSLNIPIISDDPLSFLIHVYKNYLKIPALEDEYYTKKIFPEARSSEICLNADAFLNAFELSPADYPEVEPGWFCLASKEIVR